MSRCKFSSGKPFEGGASCLKQTTARKKSRLLSRSLAFISIFCVLALLFTSLTPLSVFAEDLAPATREDQGVAGSGEPNGEKPVPPADPNNTETPADPNNTETPADPNNTETPANPNNTETPVDPNNPETPVDPNNPETPAVPEVPVTPEQPEHPNPENNVSDLNATLVIDEVVAGATAISGKIETEEALPPYDLILEIIDKDGGKHTAELKADPDVPFNPEWKIDLPEDYPSLQPGDQITITIKIPETEWELSESTEVSVPRDIDVEPNMISPPVGQSTLPAPTIGKVFYDATTISGGKLHRDRVGGKIVRATVHVTLKNKDGIVKDQVSVTPTTGNTWTVNLTPGIKVAKGDTVTAYQELNGVKSPDATADAEESIAGQTTLKMPAGEIWIEQTSANIVNNDEQAEAVEMLKNANPDIANDFKSVKFSIDGTNHAYYEVTYTDGSISGKVEAPDLKIKQVTEYSRGATLNDITIVDSVIKGKLAGEGPFDGIKVQLILKLSEAVKDSYCEKGKCSVDKDTSNPVSATVDGTTGEFSYTIPNPDLKLDQVIGVTVKEKNKFKSCSKTTVKPVTVGKTDVRDPRKLTDADKGKIIEAIKTAYTVNGESKLPNGTGQWAGVPAVIQFDDSGNVKIFSGNDVAGTWDPSNDYKFVPETNEDGSYKLKDGAEPKITIPAKDLLKNIKPDAPKVALSEDKKNITITPNEKDTDANSISVSYTGKDGSTKTITATKADDGTWSITGEGTVANGVITLPKDKVKGDTTVTATVTDKGGIADDDKDPLTSDPGTLNIKETKAEKVEALGGLDPVVMKKWVGDKVDWKDGVKASDSASDDNKAKIKEFLDEAKTTFADENSRGTTAEGDFIGKVKVTFDDGSFIEVADQNLYVSNHVTSMERKDKVPTDALDVEFKLGEGIKVDNTGSGAIEGNKDNPTSYSKYKVKPGTDLKDYKLPNLSALVIDSIKVTPQEGYTEPVWRDSKNGKDFVATTDNNVFTATATKTFKVTVQANGGTGDDKVETKKSGESFTLPAKDTFTPPKNKEFAGWLVGDATTTTDPGTEITITSDTVIKASWKPIMVDVNFDAGEGSGTMNKETVKKGSTFKLPPSKFKAPENKEFKGWKIGEKEYQVGDEITVNENTTVTAQWAKKPDPKNPDDKPQNPPVNPGDKPRGFVPIPGGNTPNLQVIPGANPQILRVQPAPSPSASTPRVYKTLPRTGESNGLPLMASALLALIGGALILSRKRS